MNSIWAQLNFGGPQFFLQILDSFKKSNLAANSILLIFWVRGWGKMAPRRVRVNVPRRVRDEDAKLVGFG